jgi:hypothetical protein
LQDDEDKVKQTTESGCQTEFVKRSGRLIIEKPEQKTQQPFDHMKDGWTTDTITATNKLTTTTNTVLPVRRKKAMLKKPTVHNTPQQNQTLTEKWRTQPQVTPTKVNSRNQNFTAADFVAAFNSSPDGAIPSADMLTATIDTNIPGFMDIAASDLDPAFLEKGLDGSSLNLERQRALAGHLGMTKQYIQEWMRHTGGSNSQINYDADGTPLAFSNFPHIEELIHQKSLDLGPNTSVDMGGISKLEVNLRYLEYCCL